MKTMLRRRSGPRAPATLRSGDTFTTATAASMSSFKAETMDLARLLKSGWSRLTSSDQTYLRRVWDRKSIKLQSTCGFTVLIDPILVALFCGNFSALLANIGQLQNFLQCASTTVGHALALPLWLLHAHYKFFLSWWPDCILQMRRFVPSARRAVDFAAWRAFRIEVDAHSAT